MRIRKESEVVKKLAVTILVLAALLLPAAVSSGPNASGQAAQLESRTTTASATLSSLLAQNSTVYALQSQHAQAGSATSLAGLTLAAAPVRRCRLGAWASAESVATVRRGGYVHVATITDARRYFPALEGRGVLRTFRCPSLQCMEDLANQARAQGIPFDAFGYDLEGWDQTPLWEREHQVEATRMARALADRYGVKLVMGPARAFTWRNWPQMAPYAHMWIIQAQAGQRQYPAGAQFANWLAEYVGYLSTNPNMPIWAQLSTNPDQPLTLPQYMAYVDSVKPSLIDGVYVFNPRDQLPLIGIWNAECGQ